MKPYATVKFMVNVSLSKNLLRGVLYEKCFEKHCEILRKKPALLESLFNKTDGQQPII